MYTCLAPHLLQMDCSSAEAMTIATDLGFGGVSFDSSAIQAMKPGERRDLAVQMTERGLSVGPWSLPLRWRRAEALFRSELDELGPVVEAMAALGPSVATTWVASFSTEFEWNDNLKLHCKRLRQIGDVLAAAGDGMRLAVEFVGARKIRRGFRFEFIHRLGDLASLCVRTACANVGLLLDSWSIYASGDLTSDLIPVEGLPVYAVEIGDAPRNVALSQLDETERHLPGAEGAIDNALLLAHLRDLDYDGSVAVEAYAGSVERMAGPERAEAAKRALDGCFVRADMTGMENR